MRARKLLLTCMLTCLMACLLGFVLASPGWAAGPASAPASNTSSQARGKVAFDAHCAACHGRERVADNQMLPATASLAIKYQGAVPPALEDRVDLTAPFVKYTVRHGVALMPFFRKTMLSDAELDAIADYLSRNLGRPVGTPDR